MRLLRQLDQWLLPPLGRVLHRLGRGAARLRVLYVLAFLSVGAVLLTAVWTAAGHRPAGDPTVGDTVRVGVVQGQSIPAYVAASRTELASMVAAPPTGAEETYALVTLRAYLAPNRLTPVLGGVAVSQVYARVPLPDTQTEIVRIPAYRVPADVEAGMDAVATRKEQEAADYRRLAAKLPGQTEAEGELRTRYAGNAEVAAKEATAYREHCSCVYGAVVRATPAALDQIATRPEVRAVDPAPEVRRLDRAVFLPPLPEQDGLAKPPADGVSSAPVGSPTPEAPSDGPGNAPGAAAEHAGARPDTGRSVNTIRVTRATWMIA